MSTKLTLVEGIVAIYGPTGNVAAVVQRADSKFALATQAQLLGRDGVHTADVFLDEGVRRLQTSAKAVVESLLGEVVFPYTWIEVHDIGDIGDTMRTYIPDDSIDVTTTRTAGHLDDNDLAKQHRDDLKADGNFSALYEASVPRASHLVCLQAKLIQTLRPDSNDVQHFTTGNIDTTLAFDTFIDRPIALAIFPHPLDCRKGTINVTGEIGVIETGRPPIHLELMEVDENIEQNVVGSLGAPRIFKLSNNPKYIANNEKDFIVTELRFEATTNAFSIGANKYIKVTALTNGHMFQIRSDGNLEYDETLKVTEDIHHQFAFGAGSKFDLVGQSAYSLVAVFARPFFIRKIGTFGTPDEIIVTVQDNLSAIGRIRVSAVGFFEE